MGGQKRGGIRKKPHGKGGGGRKKGDPRGRNRPRKKKEVRNYYEKKVREINLMPTKADEEDVLPRRARDLFNVKIIKGMSQAVLDNGKPRNDEEEKKRGRKVAMGDVTRTEKYKRSELLVGQLPGERLRDFENRLNRGVEAALQSVSIKKETSEGRKRRNKARKDKVKRAGGLRRPVRNDDGGDEDADDDDGDDHDIDEEEERARKRKSSIAVGLHQVAMEPPKFTVVPKVRS